MGRVRTGSDGSVSADDREQLARALAGIAALDLPGQLSMSVGDDLGLREGGWSFAIVNDWVDEAAYRGYDADPEHNRHRVVVGALCEDIARVQFSVG